LNLFTPYGGAPISLTWSLLDVSPNFLSTKQNRLLRWSSLWTLASPNTQQCPSSSYYLAPSIKNNCICPTIVFPPSGVLIPYNAHHFSLASKIYPIIYTGFSGANAPALSKILTYYSPGFVIFKWYTDVGVTTESLLLLTQRQNTTNSFNSTCFNFSFLSILNI